MTKVLIIDDEQMLLEEVSEWLTVEGYHVATAEDGLEGIEKAFSFLPDLIICDITMPHLDGHAVLLALRADAATTDTPFIFVTARASHEDIRTGMNLGADDYITKPFTRLELLRAIISRLEKKQTHEQKRQEEVQQWQEAFEKEREQRLLKAKLVAMFSHDFRNPLTSITSSLSLLRDYGDRLDEERRMMHFHRSEIAVRQLLQMLDDMMVVAQMETGTLQYHPEQLDLGEFVDRIVQEFQVTHQNSHNFAYQNHVNSALQADPRLLHQIVSNLLSNAVKYSPKGSEIRVELYQLETQYCLTVTDEGIGIPEVDQPRLFNAFQRASNVGQIQGTGLGLAIVKEAVQLQGGAIELDSNYGSGTTITIRLPYLSS